MRFARARVRPAALAAAVTLACGCSWATKSRPARPREVLEAESFTVTLPEGPGWRVDRDREAGWREFQAIRYDERGAWERQVRVTEGVTRAGATVAPGGEEELAWVRAELRRLVGDPDALVTELPAAPDPRFGPAAWVAVARAEESDARAGLLVKQSAFVALLEFVPPQAPDRLCIVRYEQARRRRGAPEEAEQRWRALVADVALRPVDAEAIRRAARPDFPKQFEPGLARRSLTLPKAGLQWTWGRERWIAPGGFAGHWGLSYGITDRAELSLPAYLRFAFGDPAALVGPEIALGAGLSRYEHDAARGSVWGGAVSAAARKRLGGSVAAIAQATLELAHESRTGTNAVHGGGAAGIRWEPTAPRLLAEWVSLGLEAGYASRDVGLPSRRLAWLGGRTTPLVTVHGPFLDLGLTGGIGWDGEDLGALVGFALALTF